MAMYAAACKRLPMLYVFKPLTTVLVIALAVYAGSGQSIYFYVILAGLLLSLVGDILLMLPSDRFVPGLVSFLMAHLFYIAGFTIAADYHFSLESVLPFLVFAVVMIVLLYPKLGEMKVPVIIYTGVIMIMGWRALDLWSYTDQVPALSAFIGAIFFMISDSALAWERFRNKFPCSQPIILGTYFVAQTLIAWSCGLDH